ncbi:cytochrome P450 [Actinokineospora fastidiosa]|uniref:Cytochrome P450 n=1 Tax=Actinokineospora fastidiosa TaxID=1816 RepID=A0A918GGV9_9PSEU|nr:cytochrome P450 [Actinokineospora fastidiosa]
MGRVKIRSVLNTATAPFDPEGYLRRQRALRGDPVIVRVPGSGRLVVTGDPEGARELFAGPVELFATARPNMVEPLLGPGSLIMVEGDRHRHERRLLAPPFHGRRMRAYGEIIQRVTLDRLGRHRAGEPVDVLALGQAVTLAVIVRAIFGVEDSARGERFASATARLLAGYTPALAMPAFRHTVGRLGPAARLRRRLAEFDALLTAEIDARREAGVDGREDILSLLLTARYEDGGAMSASDLLDELRTMVVAGHETTATSLAWAMYHLHREPGAARRLRDELAPLGTAPAPDDLAALPYLGAVCQEAMRLHPVVPMVARMLTAPWRFRGVDLVAGDTAAVATSLLHHNPEVWDEPFAFRPDRFLDSKPRPHEYAPFGGGHRRCIGAAFGEYEMRVVLGTLVSAGRFTPSDRARPVPRARPHSITLGPSRPLTLVYDGPV